MITLAVFSFILDLGSGLLNYLFSPVLQNFNELTQFITAFAIPQTIIDVYGLVCYFLPVATIAVLLILTSLIILFKTFVSVIHFLGFGLIFGE